MAYYLIGTAPGSIELASLLLRLFIGVCFVIHGLGKLGIVGPGNMEGFVGWLKALKVPAPKLMASFAMLSELLGGTLIAFGFFHRPACFILIITMFVATFIGHRGGGYLITNNPPGNEYALNLIVILIVMFLLGPGPYSLDAMIFGF